MCDVRTCGGSSVLSVPPCRRNTCGVVCGRKALASVGVFNFLPNRAHLLVALNTSTLPPRNTPVMQSLVRKQRRETERHGGLLCRCVLLIERGWQQPPPFLVLNNIQLRKIDAFHNLSLLVVASKWSTVPDLIQRYRWVETHASCQHGRKECTAHVDSSR